MSDATLYSKAFARARLQAADNLRRNGNLSAATRLVGLEIFSYVNRISGCAFPSEETIAARLGIDVRTVRRALPQLAAAGCFKVMSRRGRSNVYFPPFVDRTEDFLSGVEPTLPGGKLSSDRGQKRPGTEDKTSPLTLSSNSGRTLSKEASEKKQTQREKLKARQKAENEMADLIGWSCLQEIPPEIFEDLCRRWLSGDVDKSELFELKHKYEPTAAIVGRRTGVA